MFGRKRLDKADWVQRMLVTYERSLTRYAFRLVKDTQTAKEVVQDTFLRLWNADMDEVKDHPAEWLFTVCRNRAFDIVRKERPMKSPLDPQQIDRVADQTPPVPNVLELRQTNSALLAVLDRLPENQQEVVRLKFQNGLSYKEISRITGHSVSNVGFLLHVALKEIRSQFRDDEHDAAGAAGGGK